MCHPTITSSDCFGIRAMTLQQKTRTVFILICRTSQDLNSCVGRRKLLLLCWVFRGKNIAFCSGYAISESLSINLHIVCLPGVIGPRLVVVRIHHAAKPHACVHVALRAQTLGIDVCSKIHTRIISSVDQYKLPGTSIYVCHLGRPQTLLMF